MHYAVLDTLFLAGVGRFRNKSYVDFLKSWNIARRLKTKIGPVEVQGEQILDK